MLHGQAEGGHMLTKICTNVHANKLFDENRVLTLVLYNIAVCDVDDLVEKTHLHCRVQMEPAMVQQKASTTSVSGWTEN